MESLVFWGMVSTIWTPHQSVSHLNRTLCLWFPRGQYPHCEPTSPQQLDILQDSVSYRILSCPCYRYVVLVSGDWKASLWFCSPVDNTPTPSTSTPCVPASNLTNPSLGRCTPALSAIWGGGGILYHPRIRSSVFDSMLGKTVPRIDFRRRLSFD